MAPIGTRLNWDGHPGLTGGTDRRVPPDPSEGHACRAREKGIDDRKWHNGPDERVPSVEFGFHTIACGCSRYYWQRISDDMSQDRRIARPLANGDDPWVEKHLLK